MLKRLLFAFVCIGVFGGPDTQSQETFPRIAGVMIGGPHAYNDPDYQVLLAKNDLLILGMWPGWGDREQAVASLKALNSNLRVFLYVNNNEFSPSNLTFKQVLDKLDNMGWWAYETGSSGSIVGSGWQNLKQTNLTSFVPADSTGMKFSTWIAQWQAKNYLAAVPSADGLFEDIFFWKPRVNADWNRDGVTDNRSDVVVQRWWREGYRSYAQAVQLQPEAAGKLILANTADWGQSDAVLSEYQALVHGGTFEGAIGESWSVESWGGWKSMMEWYRKMKTALKAPQILIFMQVGAASDYQSMRYGLASCLMDDGYYFFTTTNAYSPPQAWFDEFDADLGMPVQSPTQTSWQNGVYRRDFERGIVLVNPKGNGQQTVQLEGEYIKLDGRQDRIVNDGSAVRAITLKDRDGIILLSRRPRAVPMPPSSIKAN